MKAAGANYSDGRLQVPGCVTPAPSLFSPAPALSSPAPPASLEALLWWRSPQSESCRSHSCEAQWVSSCWVGSVQAQMEQRERWLHMEVEAQRYYYQKGCTGPVWHILCCCCVESLQGLGKGCGRPSALGSLCILTYRRRAVWQRLCLL